MAINLNKAFVDVPKILEAQDRKATLTVAWRARYSDTDVTTTLQMYNEDEFKSSYFQFHVLDDIEA